jgi:hypothetical protein
LRFSIDTNNFAAMTVFGGCLLLEFKLEVPKG